MPIPNLGLQGELPPGIYVATMQEVEDVFGSSNGRRKLLMNGLKKASLLLKRGNVSEIFIDGSFITDKEEPNDIDGCWSSIGVQVENLDPRFWDFSDVEDFELKRMSLKLEFGIDFYIAEVIEGGSGRPFPEFFQTNREGRAKGILAVRL